MHASTYIYIYMYVCVCVCVHYAHAHIGSVQVASIPLGRPLGYYIFSLIGRKRTLFTNIFSGFKGPTRQHCFVPFLIQSLTSRMRV